MEILGNGDESEIEDLVNDDEGLEAECADLQEPMENDDNLPPPPTISRSKEPRQKRDSRKKSRRKRTWKQTPFTDKSHDFPELPKNTVRTSMEYFRDYFDDNFFEKASTCSNLYHLRKTGRELNTNPPEMSKMIGLHIIMGCIPYPQLPMYWRANMKLLMISEVMSRDRFLALRNAFHVVETDDAPPEEAQNPLWKVQPVITRVQNACTKLERVPGYYSIDEQMIPFTGRCKLRQVVKNKPRPVGLKNFVLTTSGGLMLDFAIYQGAKSTFGDTPLGLGPSVILHLAKSVPPGSCLYFDRYFTTVPLIKQLHAQKLHGTGTIMLNRLAERTNIKFKNDRVMLRGESQQFVSEETALVKWKDNKSVLMVSNCTGAENKTSVKRWDKRSRSYIDISAPKIVQNYNMHMGGVDVLDQLMEYYRTFIKTKKWTLKVLIHFVDLALVNAWRLYKNDCLANGVPRNKTLTLLEFRLDVADGLVNKPEKRRRSVETDEEEDELPSNRKYRQANPPSVAKRYDGYNHLPIFDEINAPRVCRYENCRSRSKIRCEKCNVYLCLSRGKNCFYTYHKKI